MSVQKKIVPLQVTEAAHKVGGLPYLNCAESQPDQNVFPVPDSSFLCISHGLNQPFQHILPLRFTAKSLSAVKVDMGLSSWKVKLKTKN